MKIDYVYIFSQVFVVINYTLLIFSYQLKNRRTILIVNFISVIATAISYLLLSAYTGLAMTGVALIRSIIFLNGESKKKRSKKITKKDIKILAFLYFISILLAILTYDGILSLMSVSATMLYTYSIWQKSTKVYKIVGVPVCISAIIYNIYIHSILGVIFEIFLAISAIIGLICENISSKYSNIKELKYEH